MSTMKNHLGSFLSRLMLPGLVALLVLMVPALVRADAITTFAVKGTAFNNFGKLDSCAHGATCAFSGMFQVDTTTGTLESTGFDITLPGLPSFDSLFASIPGTPWRIEANNSVPDILILDFSTAPTAGSLVGFTGGSILAEEGDLRGHYSITGGSITPAPEPSSLILFASGLLVFGLTRRFGKKVGYQLSA